MLAVGDRVLHPGYPGRAITVVRVEMFSAGVHAVGILPSGHMVGLDPWDVDQLERVN